MKTEIQKGLDIYLENAHFLYKKSKAEVTKAERKLVKIMMLAILYGQHYTSMSVRTGIDVEICKKFIDCFYQKYLGICAWHTFLQDEVKNVCKLSGNKLPIYSSDSIETITMPGYFQLKSQPMFFGKRYTFYNKGKKTRNGIFEYWHTPDIKNFPVQGTAATVTAGSVAQIYKWLMHHQIGRAHV